MQRSVMEGMPVGQVLHECAMCPPDSGGVRERRLVMKEAFVPLQYLALLEID